MLRRSLWPHLLPPFASICPPFWLHKLRFSGLPQFNTNIPRIRIRKDRSLDAVADQVKPIVPILKLRDIFLHFQRDAIPLRFLTIKRRNLGLRMTEEKFEDFVREYPTIFEVFTNLEEKLPWIRLTPGALELIEEERLIHEQQEPATVEKLRKLLMLAHNQQIRANRITMLAPFFGFPNDIVTRVVPKYPQFFDLVQHGKPYQTLELVSWDDSLAITEFEKKAKADAIESGLGDIETRGYPLRFKTQYSPGVVPKKKAFAYLDKWQKLPYVCPYMGTEGIEDQTPLADRRMVALLHEVLSLSVEKKITIEVLNHLQKDFQLPGNLYKAVNRYPGIFYVSVKGAVHTLYLREAYDKQRLFDEYHPLLTLRKKYCKLVRNGPRLRSMIANAIRNVKR